ncbi:hypothetical protein M1437_02535 [Patescibacteria group bacterium]|nr:hypothetical protein [Patescibacteria group bacterium]
MSIEHHASNVILEFGTQLDHLVERHSDFLHKPEEVSVLWPDLKGHERAMVSCLGKAVVERQGLLTKYGFGDVADQIIRDRRDIVLAENADRLVKSIVRGFMKPIEGGKPKAAA